MFFCHSIPLHQRSAPSSWTIASPARFFFDFFPPSLWTKFSCSAAPWKQRHEFLPFSPALSAECIRKHVRMPLLHGYNRGMSIFITNTVVIAMNAGFMGGMARKSHERTSMKSQECPCQPLCGQNPSGRTCTPSGRAHRACQLLLLNQRARVQVVHTHVAKRLMSRHSSME
jgi:hypothetical protein